ncbi:cysteine proteinase inhibitor 4 [Phtheirospermum japonicum]|uniref:Cysteine proteinase inhibitor 4 n=1 Tax=Phtheirospermum japonicum TaxID=374723 RepID=A0A830D5X3_9LAMI|nr:cysteine proteinase inhibitor 4 [Phtheirospermum japonicum]
MKLILQLLSYSFLLILVLIPGKGDNNSHPTSNEHDARGILQGHSEPIRNLKEPVVIKAAKFAVTQHNRNTNSTLTFIRVVEGEIQPVQSAMYRLTISAKDGRAAKPKLYRVKVWSRLWVKRKPLRLECFEEIQT